MLETQKLFKLKLNTKLKNFNHILVSEYINSTTKTDFKCLTHNFNFSVRPGAYVNRGQGCHFCNKTFTHSKQVNFEKFKTFCLKHDINVLSTEWKGHKTKMYLQCNFCKYCFYRGASNAYSKKQLLKCPKCNDTIAFNLTNNEYYTRLINVCKQSNYNLLSKLYVNCKEKLEFECSDGHKFSMTPDSFIQGNRCKECAYKKNISGLYKLHHYKTKKSVLIKEEIELYLCLFTGSVESFYKVGLSTNSDKRFKSLKSKYKITYLFKRKLNTFSAGLIELSILKMFEKFKYIPINKFNGYTECFNLGINLNLMFCFLKLNDPIKKEGELLEYLEAK